MQFNDCTQNNKGKALQGLPQFMFQLTRSLKFVITRSAKFLVQITRRLTYFSLSDYPLGQIFSFQLTRTRTAA